VTERAAASTSFAGQIALITGGATGLGAAVAEQLAARGASALVLNYSRSAAEAEETAERCRKAGAEVVVVQGDVASDADCRKLADAAARFGKLDVLVNNAGTTKHVPHANLDGLSADDFHRIYGVNVVGAFQMVRACVAHLKAARGAIVNVSSVAGSLGIGSSVPYIASKGAINSLTLHLARTLAPEIRVNAVCPGMITTRWFVDGIGEQAYEKLKAQYEQTTPLARACSAEDVAEAVIWLLEGARTVTGELIQLDSGMHLGTARPVVRTQA
jgi:3-oxoacyl-[acyl-carrier protein] reductase